jgi:alanyl-tRNA synthetase
MHAALRAVLGRHVQQKGSLVDAERTRFDFSHDKAVTPEEIRRIEAVTGKGAVEFVQALDRQMHEAAYLLKAPASELTQKIAQVQDNVKALEKELARLKSRLASSQGDDLSAQAVDIKGVKVLAAAMEGADAKSLRETLDKLKDKLKSAVIVLGAVEGGKVQLAAGVTADATARVKAGDLVNFVAQQVGGKGGGRPDMAMAGGTDPSRLSSALASVKSWAEQRL